MAWVVWWGRNTYVCMYHTYIHTYIHTCILAYIHTCIHTYMHTYLHTYIRTYVYTYIGSPHHPLHGYKSCFSKSEFVTQTVHPTTSCASSVLRVRGTQRRWWKTRKCVVSAEHGTSEPGPPYTTFFFLGDKYASLQRNTGPQRLDRLTLRLPFWPGTTIKIN